MYISRLKYYLEARLALGLNAI